MSKNGKLILTFYEGQSFYVANEKYTVLKILTPMRYKIMKHGAIDTKIDLGNNPLEIGHGAVMYAAKSTQWDKANIAFEAPKNVRINRAKIHEQQNS